MGSSGVLLFGMVCAILFSAAFLQGVTGFGFGMVAMALLPFVMSARLASVVVAFMALVNTGYLTWQLRKSVNWRILLPLLAGATFGVPIGVYALKTFPESLLKRLIGFAILGYCAYYTWSTLRASPWSRELPSWWRFPIGVVAGAFGGAVNVGGPPVILYIYSQPWSRDLIRATLVTYFALVTALKIALLFAQQMVTTETVSYLVSVPVIWAGSSLGLWIGRRMKAVYFQTIVIGALTFLGLLLLIRG
jgi:hypothetical protein